MAGYREYAELKYINEGLDDELDEMDQVDYISRYQLEHFGVGRVGEKRSESQRYLNHDYVQPPNEPDSSTPLNYKYVKSTRDLTLPLQKHPNAQPNYESPEDEELSLRKYLGVSVGLVSLITENLLSHPFVVLRRQCQVRHNSLRRHLVPFTLVPVICHLHQRQGVTTLWKGLGSCLLIRGMSLAIEDLLSKVTPWPKEITHRTTLKKFGQHLILKSVSIAVVVPFYAASLVETVQSDIASEKPGIFDVFREGCIRLLSFQNPQKGRMLPIWALIGPSVAMGISKYIFGLAVKSISTRIMQYRLQNSQQQRGARPKDFESDQENIEIYSTLLSIMSTEILFYPFETILHRIQLQGTRTIIDNLDSGYSVVPVITSYEGAADCYRSTIASEGVSGLYKGFGAMVLQFAAHYAVIRLTKWIVTQVMEVVANKPPSKVTEFYNLNSSIRSSPIDGGTAENESIVSNTISKSISSLSVE
ncbi:solute carrier family 25 member 46-like isoform X2 [Contarinia nasturtii]|uniref:solute carrier family 25 member 46-like isoform X2 n=1 Tax=Contarinia nasturtii TaxID=265458 RepID=UPI0012D3E428|nr:solute carrier family 25 member 46-like isoform X2 [Contarinia nasturtii]